MKRLAPLLLTPLCLQGLDLHYAPWFGNSLEFELTPFYTFGYFNSLNCSTKAPYSQDHTVTLKNPYDGYSHRLGLSFDFTLADWFVYSQATGAKTKYIDFDFEQWQAFVSYRWFDDICGDFLSLTTSFQVNIGTNVSANDLALFHNGPFELELHSAIGKEWSYFDTWIFHTFLDLSFGVANQGSPFAKGLFVMEYNHKDCQTFSILARSWVGFGKRSLCQIVPPRGYGSIEHRNVDVGFAYQFNGFLGGILGIEGFYGLYSYNYPSNPIQLTLFLRYPFGL